MVFGWKKLKLYVYVHINIYIFTHIITYHILDKPLRETKSYQLTQLTLWASAIDSLKRLNHTTRESSRDETTLDLYFVQQVDKTETSTNIQHLKDWFKQLKVKTKNSHARSFGNMIQLIMFNPWNQVLQWTFLLKGKRSFHFRFCFSVPCYVSRKWNIVQLDLDHW